MYTPTTNYIWRNESLSSIQNSQRHLQYDVIIDSSSLNKPKQIEPASVPGEPNNNTSSSQLIENRTNETRRDE